MHLVEALRWFVHNSQTQLCCDLRIGAWTARCRVLADAKIIMSSAGTRSIRRIRSEVCFWPMRASPQRDRHLLPGDHVGPAHSTACLYHKPSPRGCARAALQGRDRTRHPPPWDSPCHRSLRSEGFDNPRCSLVCSRAGLYSSANCWGFSARSRTEVKIPPCRSERDKDGAQSSSCYKHFWALRGAVQMAY